jgi:hypothetical protein
MNWYEFSAMCLQFFVLLLQGGAAFALAAVICVAYFEMQERREEKADYDL